MHVISEKSITMFQTHAIRSCSIKYLYALRVYVLIYIYMCMRYPCFNAYAINSQPHERETFKDRNFHQKNSASDSVTQQTNAF